MNLGRGTGIILCDLCAKVLGPVYATIPYPDGSVKRFCLGEECVGDYLGTKGKSAEQEAKAVMKAICPACKIRVRALY
jgi:hypothetical protein